MADIPSRLTDIYRAAMETWPRDGVPDNPRAWLVTAGRFKGIDALRRQARFQTLPDDGADLPDDAAPVDGPDYDDRLRLIFTCCHPAVPAEARAALTLRAVVPSWSRARCWAACFSSRRGDLHHAIELIASHPGVHMGAWEIRPTFDLTPMIEASRRRRAAQG